MLALAFFRNLNLGQAGTPRSRDLVEMFHAGGAEVARSIRTNGTVALRADDPRRVVGAVRDTLAARSAWDDVVVVRDESWCLALGERLAGCPPTTEVACYDADSDFPHPLPWRPELGRLTVEHADRCHAICVNDVPRTSYATPTLERLLDLPVTSRGAETVLRAVRALAELRDA